ncbi:carbonic anhydrase [Denitrobaculum tricleocarpae]|uniref:Carbonic anhydrase n=1 Tax=Denitrobaculum tricleocarpae TaxID=2591009 RepID=A0A545TP38_9PROT|nr:carbonic anhydrase [Denitrobaculum tricleocarpae]TQV78982.1 carbonic anhydrase [Denitrobaculum tricleocarpae]
MAQTHDDLNAKAFSLQPGYDETLVRAEFAELMPLRTVIIYCFDPRASGIPDAVARDLGDVWPGEAVTDAGGEIIGTTTSVLNVVVAGGRALDALRSITVAQHLLGVENIAVVHHTHCGATSYTAEGIVKAWQEEQGVDISETYPRESLCISDYVASVEHDARLIRNAPGTPRHVNVHGYVYDIDNGELTRILEDRGTA